MVELTSQVSSKLRNMSIVCAALVVVIHLRPSFDQGSVGWWIREIGENGICELAVPFFFLVSGFLVLPKIAGGGYFDVLKTRAKSLMIPFLVWNALYWLCRMLISNLSAIVQGGGVACAIPSLIDTGFWFTGCPMLTPLWYVRALMVLVIISPVLYFTVHKLGFWVLFSLLVAYAVLCPYYPLPEWNGLRNFARVGIFPVLGLFYFSFGMAIRLGMFNRFCGFLCRHKRCVGIVALCSGLILVVSRAALLRDYPFAAAYCGFAAIPFLMYALWLYIPNCHWPTWLVANSFAVYLIHKFVLLAYGYVNALIKFTFASSVLYYVISSAITFGVSLLFAQAIRRLAPRFSVVVFGGR